MIENVYINKKALLYAVVRNASRLMASIYINYKKVLHDAEYLVYFWFTQGFWLFSPGIWSPWWCFNPSVSVHPAEWNVIWHGGENIKRCVFTGTYDGLTKCLIASSRWGTRTCWQSASLKLISALQQYLIVLKLYHCWSSSEPFVILCSIVTRAAAQSVYMLAFVCLCRRYRDRWHMLHPVFGCEGRGSQCLWCSFTS